MYPKEEKGMSKLKVSTREIGCVRVFDLEGSPTQEDLQEIAWKIQRNIRRHRLQRVILNLQRMPLLDPLGVRKLLAACLRPQQSLIYGASKTVRTVLENTYLPRNIRLCDSEVAVAEDLGPFLLEKGFADEFQSVVNDGSGRLPPGIKLERRRSKRMHVALPLHLKIAAKDGQKFEAEAIATNISEGGLFAEYLDLEAAEKIEHLDPMNGLSVEILVHSSANFPEEYRLNGLIRRKELRKKQLGIGIEFLEDA